MHWYIKITKVRRAEISIQTVCLSVCMILIPMYSVVLMNNNTQQYLFFLLSTADEGAKSYRRLSIIAQLVSPISVVSRLVFKTPCFHALCVCVN